MHQAYQKHAYLKLYSVLLCVLFTSSCETARFYTPHRIPLPLFKSKGDFYASASSNVTNKMDAVIGYAFRYNFAAYAGFGFSREQSPSTGLLKAYQIIETKGQMLNIGAGYYLNHSFSNRLRCEVFVDYVSGKYYFTKDPTYDEYLQAQNKVAYLNGQYNKLGLLCNIGTSSRNSIFRYAYSTRFSGINFINASFTNGDRLDLELRRLNNRKNYYVLDQGFNVKIGSGAFKFQIQTAFYYGFKTDESYAAVQNMNGSMMLGFSIEFGQNKKKM